MILNNKSFEIKHLLPCYFHCLPIYGKSGGTVQHEAFLGWQTPPWAQGYPCKASRMAAKIENLQVIQQTPEKSIPIRAIFFILYQ